MIRFFLAETSFLALREGSARSENYQLRDPSQSIFRERSATILAAQFDKTLVHNMLGRKK
jgi:hypothetical protein